MNAPSSELPPRFQPSRAALPDAPPESLAAAKRATRRQMRARLQSLAVDRAKTADALFQNLESLPAFRNAKVVGVYLDFGKEAPVIPFLPRLFSSSPFPQPNAVENTPSKIVAAPFCDGDALRFYRIDAPTFDDATGSFVFSNLDRGSFGILEPNAALRSDPNRAVAPSDFDVLLIPGLAFDADGRRLGRGAGYYDRFLPLLPSKTRLLGVAFDEQILEKVPTTPRDFDVDAVVTPTRILAAFER